MAPSHPGQTSIIDVIFFVSKSAYHLSELTGPGELVLAGLNGKKRTSLDDYARESCVKADVNNKTTWRS